MAENNFPKSNVISLELTRLKRETANKPALGLDAQNTILLELMTHYRNPGAFASEADQRIRKYFEQLPHALAKLEMLETILNDVKDSLLCVWAVRQILPLLHKGMSLDMRLKYLALAKNNAGHVSAKEELIEQIFNEAEKTIGQMPLIALKNYVLYDYPWKNEINFLATVILRQYEAEQAPDKRIAYAELLAACMERWTLSFDLKKELAEKLFDHLGMENHYKNAANKKSTAPLADQIETVSFSDLVKDEIPKSWVELIGQPVSDTMSNNFKQQDYTSPGRQFYQVNIQNITMKPMADEKKKDAPEKEEKAEEA